VPTAGAIQASGSSVASSDDKADVTGLK